jgi:phthalate 4,5-cis-dihydrodiol dehydrogenase
MALTLDECDRMIAAADSARVALVVGPTHSFDPPVQAAREVIRSGRVGALRMVNGWVYTDFLYRPRRPEELDTARGGGVLFNQAPHHVDVVRLLGGGLVRSVRSVAGAWDPQRPTEGAYAALLEFESGAAATIVYSGYAHFDSDELNEWVGELGEQKKPAQHGSARRFLSQLAGDDEAQLKSDTGYGGTRSRSLDRRDDAAAGHPHFGIWIASCDRADLRATPTGLCIYADQSIENVDIPRDRSEGRAGVLDELVDAINTGKPNLHDGRWGKATLEVCIAMLESSRTKRDVRLEHQCAPNEPAISGA